MIYVVYVADVVQVPAIENLSAMTIKIVVS
jgi:hypothetical protein